MPGATIFDLVGSEQRRATPLPRLIAESLRLAWRTGRRELLTLLALQVGSLIAIAAEVLLAHSLVSGLVEGDRAGGELGALVPQIVALTVITAALGVAQALQRHEQRMLAELCVRYGEEQVLRVTGSVELAAFDLPGFHDEVARALLAVRRLPAVITNLSGILGGALGALGAIVGLIAIQPVFAPVVALVLVPSWIAARRRGRAFYHFARLFTPRDRERQYLAETLVDRDAAKEIRAYDLPGFLGERHSRLWDERLTELGRVARRQLAINVAAVMVATAILTAALTALLALTLSDQISLADAGVTAAAIVLIGQRLNVAVSSASGLSESALFMDDYLALTALAPGPRAAPAESVPARLHARAEGVSFSYPGAPRPALRNISLEVCPGEVVALVGENGSGKTTLAKLLAGLYLPDSGSVRWNGVETASAERDGLARGVAVIFQDFLRYALPARENIALGRHERIGDEEAVRRAAQAAGAHEDVERLPRGYETMLGPAFHGGTDLSLGQWQRLALARALFRDAPLVILDEPTAALDAQAEHDLFLRIRELLRGRSVLLISHRFSTVRVADRIHVMRAGCIVESGSHDELVAAGGAYARMFEVQAAPYR
jgi:ATP-binding cassette subfamily B protein